MTIKKGDFVEIEFTGRVKTTNQVFDTNMVDVAKVNNLYDEKLTYQPMIIKVGEQHILKGIDMFVEGKELGSYSLDITAENAFGKKDAKLLRYYSISEFHKHKINPVPGLEVDMDNHRGLVRSVSGGRVLVDFNHPLASHDVSYDVKINRIVTDAVEKVQGVLRTFKIPYKEVVTTDGKVTITFETQLPEQFSTPIADELKRLIGLEVEFK